MLCGLGRPPERPIMSRVLAIDPGDKRIGVAISDPTRTIARPLTVIEHTSRELDASAIGQLAAEHSVQLILVGLPFDLGGEIGPQARKALRLADAVRRVSEIEVRTWDESGSTEAAAAVHDNDVPLDARAAAVILQDFLDAAAEA